MKMQWAQYNAAVMARKPKFPWLEVLRMTPPQLHAHRRTCMAQNDAE
jgi:hypothetical protein